MSERSRAWWEIGLTVVAPMGILGFGAGALGPTGALLLALAFPAAWAVASMVRERQVSALAAISLGSVALTGGIGLLELDPRWFAVKEGLVPLAFGAAITGSAATRWSVVPVVLERVLDRERLDAALDATGRREDYTRAARTGTVRIGIVTALGGGLSAALAAWMVRSAPGTEAFAAELSRYTGASFVAVTLPLLAASVWVLQGVLTEIERAAGRSIDELLPAKAEP